MAACSTPLKERQNFSLNESSISTNGSHLDKSLNEKMDALIKKVDILEKKLGKRPVKGVTASKLCAQLVRQTYKAMEESIGWNLNAGFSAPENTTKTGRLIHECQLSAENQLDCTKEELLVAAKTFYRSLHDREIRRQNGKLTAHKMANKRGDRLRRKLKSRKDALKKIDWSEKKKEKVRTVLTTNYMSSESSCSEESDRETLTIRPLQWESRKLRKYKKKLDKCSKEAMSLKSVRLRRKRNRNKEKPSLRLVPRDIPGWAHREAAATEEKITTAETENNENTTLDRDPFDFGSESDFDYPL